MKLLHLDSSILDKYSVSRELSALIVHKIKNAHADVEVTYRDLDKDGYPHATLWTLPFDPDSPVAPDTRHPEQVRSEATLEEFLETDIVVMGAPMYNYTIPSQLKAWIDRIVIARKTFRYGEHGPIGLVSGKRIIAAITSGGIYSPGTPAAALDYSVSYLRAMFEVLGVTMEFVIAEGLAMGPAAKARGIGAAHAAIEALPV